MRIIPLRRLRVAGMVLLLGWVLSPHFYADPAEATPTEENDFAVDNLDVLDADLKGKLVILRVGSNRANNNLLAVFAGLKNKTSHVLALEAQTIYKDGSGTQLNQGTASWITINLKPHQEITYRSASLSDDAVDFVVRVRRARN